jgi:hypothetical protein
VFSDVLDINAEGKKFRDRWKQIEDHLVNTYLSNSEKKGKKRGRKASSN